MCQAQEQSNHTAAKNATANATAADFITQKARQYLQPIENHLNQSLDKRLVATFTKLFLSILLFRNSKMSLLLSELGSFVAGYAHAPAGTKRMAAANRQQSATVEEVDLVNHR